MSWLQCTCWKRIVCPHWHMVVKSGHWLTLICTELMLLGIIVLGVFLNVVGEKASDLFSSSVIFCRCRILLINVDSCPVRLSCIFSAPNCSVNAYGRKGVGKRHAIGLYSLHSVCACVCVCVYVAWTLSNYRRLCHFPHKFCFCVTTAHAQHYRDISGGYRGYGR